MNELMTKWFGASWRTTVGGAMAALPQAANGAALAAGVTLNHWVVFASVLVSSFGLLVMGASAKDNQVHSTPEQVAQASQVQKVEGQN